MASIKSIFKRTLLEKIDKEHFIKIFEPIRGILEEKGKWFDEDGNIPDSLPPYLQSTDDLPKDEINKIENDLYLISLIAKEECSEYIKEKLGEDFEPADDIYRMAGKLLLKERSFCEEVATRVFSQKTFTSEFFMPSSKIDNEISLFSVGQKANLENEFKEFFDREGKSNFVFIYQHDCDEFIYLCVEHGNSRTREVSIEGNKTKPFSYRPYVQDIIRINKKTGEVLIHLEKESKKLLKRYKISVAHLVVPDGELSPYNKFDLSSLKNGKEALEIGSLDREIDFVILKKFYFKSNWLSGYISGSKCIDEAKEYASKRVAFTSAEFEFKFSKFKQKISLTISAGNKGKIPICPQQSIIEQFLLQNNFLKMDAYEKTIPLDLQK